MRLPNLLASALRHPQTIAPAHGPIPRTAADATCPPAAPVGCGWFDSSHDLQVGLHVTEHDQPDTLVNQLPLACWFFADKPEARHSTGQGNGSRNG